MSGAPELRDASYQTSEANAVSRQGMVTTPHRLATEAGAKVLKRGGNAIEAVVAAGAALSVVYPHFCGLGGDAIWIVADREGDAQTFLGIGQSASNLPQMDTIPLRGPGSMLTTACLVDSWESVLGYSSARWGGRQTFASLLDDAIYLAEGGFPVSRSQTFWHQFRQTEMPDWQGFGNLFVESGIQRQPDLARTLKSLADRGTRDFYQGELASRIARGLEDAGSPLRAVDLKATYTQVERPLTTSFGDITLLAPPPPTQGITTLAIMGILSKLPMQRFGPSGADFYHHCVEAVKQAFLDRHRIADPDFSNEFFTDWLVDVRLAGKADAIDPHHAMPWPHPFQSGDTAFLAATDSEGRSASMLQSIYFDWGSGVVVGDTGILWQNRGAAFHAGTASPNCLRPGKRPFYTLNPGMALRHGKPHLLYGTQGADGQPQTLALLLSLLLFQGLDPLSALARPRFLLGKTFSDARDTLKIEADIGDGVVAELRARGHEVATIEPLSPLGGQAGIIRIAADGLIEGAHDPRSDGGAIGI
jgi:gamma-glutamyltranspeptidase/glutathione hydrolase